MFDPVTAKTTLSRRAAAVLRVLLPPPPPLCQPECVSCTFQNVSDIEYGDRSGFSLAAGFFANDIVQPNPGFIWYTGRGTNTGLFRYKYVVCHFAHTDLCGSQVSNIWSFENNIPSPIQKVSQRASLKGKLHPE